MDLMDQPDKCYFYSLAEELKPKRDMVAKLCQEVGMVPTIPEGGYFMMADISNLGKCGIDQSDNCYFYSLAEELKPKRDMVAKLCQEVGMVPTIPEGGYFMMADISYLGKCGIDQPDKCYFYSLAEELKPKRDMVAKLCQEVGMVPTIPEGGYFMMADISNLGKC